MSSKQRKTNKTRVVYIAKLLMIGIPIIAVIIVNYMKALRIIHETANTVLSIQNETQLTLGVANWAKSDASDIIHEESEDHFQPPQLHEIIDEGGQGWIPIKDARWLIKFSIVGFAKTGTTSLLHYLKTDDIWTANKETCNLSWNQPASLIRYFYEHAPIFHDSYTTSSHRNVIRGMKCPIDIDNNHALLIYKKYFNTTNFIVGVRHPVLWFESFYNFRLSFDRSANMLPTSKLIGPCYRGSFSVCTNRAMFDAHLAGLGKTPRSNEELSIMNRFCRMPKFKKQLQSYETIPNKVFIYDMEQLADKNESRSYIFREDLRRYIGSKSELPPMIHKSTKGEKRNVRKIDICSNEHDEVRNVLVEIGAKASQWIQLYFMKSPDVFVSSPDFFTEAIQKWGVDPCNNTLV